LDGGDAAGHPAGHADRLDWLVYHHLPGLPPPSGRFRESPVLDNYGYNQGVSRQLNEVSDVMLRAWLRLRGKGRLIILARTARPAVQLCLTTAPAMLGVSADGHSWYRRALPQGDWGRERCLEFALLDGRALVAVDGMQLVAVDLARPAGADLAPSTSEPFAVGGQRVSVELRQLAIFRDLYYFYRWDVRLGWRTERPLGPDEFLLLGDNCPVSADSRSWFRPGVPRRRLVGRVVPYR
jgi:hypothetical protein